MDGGDHRVFRIVGGVRTLLRPDEVGGTMTYESIIMLVVCALMMVYLFYALLRPEKF